MKKIVPVLLAALLLSACATVFTGIVTITSVVDSAMKDWAALSVSGQTTPQIDASVKAAHDRYRQACAVASDALVAYKNSGNITDYTSALQAVRAAAGTILDLITPLISPTEATKLQTNLAKAKTI